VNPTASALERAHHCPASMVLPGASSTSDAAERGRELHLFVSRVLGGMPRAEALDRVHEEYRATATGVDMRRIVDGMTSVRSEVSYAWDTRTRTARELGTRLDRRYPVVGPHEIVGTLDVEGVRADGVPVVPDIKTGFGEVTHPSENFQTLFFALVRSHMLGTDLAEARILSIRANGEVYSRSHEFSRFDLDDFADTLERVVDLVSKSRTALAERGDVIGLSSGPWCRYCPAFNACPEKQALVRNLLPVVQAIGGGEVERVAMRIEAMSIGDAGRAWAKLREIKPVYDAVEKALKARAMRQDIPIGNGKVAGRSSYVHESFSKSIAIELLTELGATDEQIASCTISKEVEKVIERKARV
jgi:hypothetical protein